MYLVQFVLDFPKLILIHVSKRSCTIPTLLWQVGAYCIFGSMNLQGMLLQVLLRKKVASPLQVIHFPQLVTWFHVLLTVKCFCLILHEKTLTSYWERMMSCTMEQFFYWMSKLIQEGIGFGLLCSVIGPENSRHSLDQSHAKLTTWSPAFSHVWGAELVFTLVPIGSLGYFPFIWVAAVNTLILVFTILDRKALKHNPVTLDKAPSGTLFVTASIL